MKDRAALWVALSGLLWFAAGAGLVALLKSGASADRFGTDAVTERVERALEDLRLDADQDAKIRDVLRGYSAECARGYEDLSARLEQSALQADQRILDLLDERQREQYERAVLGLEKS